MNNNWKLVDNNIFLKNNKFNLDMSASFWLVVSDVLINLSSNWIANFITGKWLFKFLKFPALKCRLFADIPFNTPMADVCCPWSRWTGRSGDLVCGSAKVWCLWMRNGEFVKKMWVLSLMLVYRRWHSPAFYIVSCPWSPTFYLNVNNKNEFAFIDFRPGVCWAVVVTL